MKNALTRFWQDEDAMGTVEVVVIIAVLISLALVFKNKAVTWLNSNVNTILDDGLNARTEE